MPPKKLFEHVKIGPVILRNRTIRSAAFEGMAPGHLVSDQLIDYHASLKGIGMTTVAYSAVNRTGLTFPHQLWMRREALPGLRKLTDAVHATGAKVSIQLGHAGNMAGDYRISGWPVAPSAKFNLYAPTWPRRMSQKDINDTAKDFGKAVRLVKEAGFDAVEVHAGHGYLISQFLSPYTNKRKDSWGGSLDNRMRFMKEVMAEVKEAAGTDTAVLVKMNTRDGFPGGMDIDESVQVARTLTESCGADALVLSGGFVSRTPMYLMRGESIAPVMGKLMPWWWLRWGVQVFGNWLIPAVPYSDTYFLEDAKRFRWELPKAKLIYIGGVSSRKDADAALEAGFDAVAIARALIREPDFVDRLQRDELEGKDGVSKCDHCNYCAARIYTRNMACHRREPAPPEVRHLLPA